MYSVFLITPKFWILYTFIIEKINNSSFGVQNWKKYHISEIAILLSVQFYVLWRFWAVFSFKPVLAALKHLQLFDKKWRNVTSLKYHFLENFEMDFSDILVANVKLMQDKVLKIWGIGLSRKYARGGGGEVIFTSSQRSAG